MTYATQQDLFDRFTQAEIDQLATLPDGSPDAAKVPQALADADAEIDAALRGRYALPLATVPELLQRVACDLARESLHDDQPTKVVEERAKRARDLLLALARGTLRIEAAAPPVTESSAGLVEFVSGRRTSPFGFGGEE